MKLKVAQVLTKFSFSGAGGKTLQLGTHSMETVTVLCYADCFLLGNYDNATKFTSYEL